MTRKSEGGLNQFQPGDGLWYAGEMLRNLINLAFRLVGRTSCKGGLLKAYALGLLGGGMAKKQEAMHFL